MISRLPWLKLYVRDWLGSPVLARFTVEQEGILLRLLLHAWELPNAALPNDPFYLMAVAKASDMKAVQKVLEQCFLPDGKGYIPREPMDLRQQLVQAERRRDQQRKAGRISAEKRLESTGTAQPQPSAAPNVRSNERSPNTRSNTRPNGRSNVLTANAGAGAVSPELQGEQLKEGNGGAGVRGRAPMTDEHKAKLEANLVKARAAPRSEAVAARATARAFREALLAAEAQGRAQAKVTR